MSKDKIEKLLELIEELVNEQGTTWKEKKKMVQDQCSREQDTALGEFTSWFE